MIKTPISRIVMPDVPRFLSALKSIDIYAEDAKSKLDEIAESVLSEERPSLNPFLSEQKDFVATNNETLYNALCEAKEGQIIFVPEENVIDMADYILCYDNGKPMQPIIRKGVTLMGERGVGSSRGAIIKSTCVARPLFVMEEGARITGLSLGGRDVLVEERAFAEHQSSAIVVAGDHVTIDNCEIAGFARCAIDAGDSKDLSVDDCYIHDIAGHSCGAVIVGDGAGAVFKNSTFVRVNSIDGTVNGNVTVSDCETLAFPTLTNPADVSLPSGCSDSTYNDAAHIKLREMLKSDTLDPNELIDLISLVGIYSNYLKYPQTIAVDGDHYGPRKMYAPIGGGEGYENIFTSGDYVVHNGKEFLDALNECKEGSVIYIDGDSTIDIPDDYSGSTSEYRFCIDKKVSIVSNRGQKLPDGSVAAGGALFLPNFDTRYLCHVKADGVRFSGLIIKGPDNCNHYDHHRRCFSKRDEKGNYVPGHAAYYKLRMGYGIVVGANDIEFENCEVCNFSSIALRFGSVRTEDRKLIESMPSQNCSVHHCYIHHNQLHGLGYGVQITSGDVEVYATLFNFNRHSIASPGYDSVVYHAHDNIEMGDSMGDYFDMHGGRDRKDGTDVAGKYCMIDHNTFMGEKNPYNLRGRILEERHFDFNVCFKPREEYDRLHLEEKKGKYLTHNHYGSGELLENVHLGKNVWGLSKEPMVLEGRFVNE